MTPFGASVPRLRMHRSATVKAASKHLLSGFTLRRCCGCGSAADSPASWMANPCRCQAVGAHGRSSAGWPCILVRIRARTLATRLWPETPEARANLRTAIWAVRQAWGAAGVHLDGQRNLIGLLPSEVWVDAIADPPVGEPLPEGELLPELDDDWLDAEREQYRRRQVTEARRTGAERRGRRGPCGCGTVGG